MREREREREKTFGNGGFLREDRGRVERGLLKVKLMEIEEVKDSTDATRKGGVFLSSNTTTLGV